MGFPNYDVPNRRVERKGLDQCWADIGRTERHVNKTLCNRRTFCFPNG
jgi:hypothetical protein